MKLLFIHISLLIAVQAFSQEIPCNLSLLNVDHDKILPGGFVMSVADGYQNEDGVYAFKSSSFTKYVSSSTATLKVPNTKIQELSENQFSLIQDLNNNESFEDDRSLVFKKNEVLRLNFPLYNPQGKKVFDLPVLFNVGKYRGMQEMVIKPLLKFAVEGHQIDGVDSIIYYPHSIIPKIYIYPKYGRPYFVVDEPFKIDSTWYVFEQPDIFEAKIQLRKIKEGEPLYGYRKGHVVNMDKLSSMVGDLFGKDAFEKEYSLHHFWGPWCGPCRAEFSDLSELSDRLEHSNIKLMNYCVIFNFSPGTAEKYRDELEILMEEGIVNATQHITVLSGQKAQECELGSRNMFLHACHPFQLFNNNSYPTYILLNKAGEILYRGNPFIDEEFMNLLDDILEKD